MATPSQASQEEGVEARRAASKSKDKMKAWSRPRTCYGAAKAEVVSKIFGFGVRVRIAVGAPKTFFFLLYGSGVTVATLDSESSAERRTSSILVSHIFLLFPISHSLSFAIVFSIIIHTNCASASLIPSPFAMIRYMGFDMMLLTTKLTFIKFWLQ